MAGFFVESNGMVK